MDTYREEILEHWQNPQNYGEIEDADLVIDQVNPLCGDEITIYIRFGADSRRKGNADLRGKRIADVTFVGKGCAISVASASMLTEAIKGQRVEKIGKITGEDVFEMLGGPVAPARIKCAFLSLEAVRKIVG